MRVRAGRALRVSPGDEIVLRARLPEGRRLGRLFVFMREREGADFSPYVPSDDLVTDEPKMHNLMSMRLTYERPDRSVKFIADFDGHVCLMQEIDDASEPLAKVRLSRKVCPSLPWRARLQRRVMGYFQ